MPDPTTFHPAPNACPACGRPVPRNAPGGLCPSCLMGQGVQLVGETQVKPGAFIPPAPSELALLFPGFDIQTCLGHGGMGAVYKAFQPALQRAVALKILPPETALDPEFIERFRREAAALARLDHPHIVRLFDYGQSESFAYFIMEYVDGVDLAQRLARGPLPLADVFAIVCGLCDALHHSHQRGIIHRDIKPANILLDSQGHVKVADFGLARLLRPENADPALTRTRASLGTPRYMAPEQMSNSLPIDQRADLFAVGVVLYEMLTGKTPAGHFEPPSQLNPDLNPRVDDVVLQALRADPHRRFSSAAQLKDALLEAISKPAPNRRQRRRRLATRILLVSSLTAVFGAGFTLAWLRHGQTPPPLPASPNPSALLTYPPSGTLTTLGPLPSLVPPDSHAPFTTVRLAAAQDEFALGLRPDGTVVAWGGNRFGQTLLPQLPRPVTQLAVGQGDTSAHALALLDDGSVLGWGDNTFQQARPPESLARHVVRALAAGERHSLALTDSGRILAWGSLAGQPASVPPDLPPARIIAAGADFNLALLQNGSVAAWGDNSHQQCRPPEFPGPVVAIAAGYHHGLAQLEDGRVVAWGDNRAGQCQVPRELTRSIRIFAGGEGSAALTSDGRLLAWGRTPSNLHPLPGRLLDLSIGSSSWALLTGD